MNTQPEPPLNLNIKIPLDFTKLDDLWCIHSHTVFYQEGPRMMFIGVCRVVDLFKNFEAGRIEDWRKYVQSANSVEVSIMAISEDKYDLYNKAMDAVETYRPFCNLNGMRDVKRGPVLCVTDERRFESAADACRAYGIPAGTMSRMLNGDKGVKSIHGKVFKRVM